MEYGCSAHYMNLAEKELGTNRMIKHAGHRGSQCAPSKRVACREGRSSATATKYHKMDFSHGLYQNMSQTTQSIQFAAGKTAAVISLKC